MKNRNPVFRVPDANFHLAVYNPRVPSEHEHAYDHRDVSDILRPASVETEPDFLGAAA